jgi:hypothetical protein
MNENKSETQLNLNNNQSNSYCVIFNIPFSYRSKHLRNYFNELIEKKAFNCFHYRHRPQKLIQNSINNKNNNIIGEEVKRFCAIIDIKTERLDELFIKFNNKFWINENGSDLEIKCFIKKIKLIDNNLDTNCTQSMFYSYFYLLFFLLNLIL